MNEYLFYKILLYGFLFAGILIFFILFFIKAPYGRYKRAGKGGIIKAKYGWIIMESPASFLFLLYFFTGNNCNFTLIIFLLIWQSHYMHRAFIYPFTIRGSLMPLYIALIGFIFNIFNTYIQARWLFYLTDISRYSLSWLYSWQFIAGVIIFYSGYYINKKSDFILKKLRQPGDSAYKIPEGRLYNLISCPNYFGEIIEWLGWAILTWSLPGIIFFIWTVCNLAPRAWTHHLWYKEKFPEYPRTRKALIPYLF